MTGGKWNVLEAESCLVSRLAKELISANTQDLRRYLVLLPTARLGTLLLAELAETLDAFLPPEVMTLQNFMSENSTLSSDVCCNDQLIVTMGHLLLQGDYTHLKLGHERELVLLFQEIAEMGENANVFDRLKEVLDQDIYSHDVPLGALYAKAEELVKLYGFWIKYFVELGKSSKADYDAKVAQLLEQDIASGEPAFLARHDHIWIAGFTSVAPAWYPLMTALAGLEKVTYWLHKPPAHLALDSPLAQLVDHVRKVVSDAKTEFERSANAGSPPILVTCDDPMSEAAYALKQASNWQAAGVPASQIGIIVSHEGTYESCLRTLLAHKGVEANCALQKPFSQTTVGVFFAAIKDLSLADNGSRRLLEFLLHPLTRKLWEEDQEIIGFMELLVGLAGSPAEVVAQLNSADISASIKDLLSLIRPLMTRECRQVRVWLGVLEELYCLIVVRNVDWDSEGLSSSVKEIVEGFFTDTKKFEFFDCELSFDTFWQLYGACLMRAEVRAVGEPLAGVQILSLSESRFVPLAAAILLGCNEGTFPKALPKDELLDDYLKRRMALKGWKQLEMMEDLTFYLLKARLPQLVLSRCKHIAEVPQIRSRFVEKLIAKQNISTYIFAFDPNEFFSLETMPPLDLEPEGGASLPAENNVRRVSASGLERLLRCPYRYHLGKQGLRPVELPSPFVDKRHEGEWLHLILETFGQNMRSLKRTAPFQDVGLSELLRLTETLGPSGVTKQPIYQQLKQHSWPQYLKHLEDVYGRDLEDMVGDPGTEVQVNPMSGALVRGKERQFFGVIDNIGSLANMTVITDFKRRNPPPSADVKKGISPQLVVYSRAYAQLVQGAQDRMLLGYWNILDGEWKPGAVSGEIKAMAIAKGLAKKNTPGVEELWSLYESAWAWREGRINSRGAFYADPSKCDFCDFEGFCRKAEPMEKSRIEAQADLNEQWLKQGATL